MSTTQFEQIQALHDQLDQTSEWFSQINQLVGADPEEPAVNSVADYVHKARLDKEVLEIVRDENEVNKKNVFKFSVQIGELKEELQQEKDGRCADLDELESEIEKLKDQVRQLQEEEEEKCEECGKALEGDDKCEAGCPAYDKGLINSEEMENEEKEIYDGQALIDAAK